MNSYKKLKEKNEELYKLYCRVIKKLKDLGQGIEGDDLLVGDEEK